MTTGMNMLDRGIFVNTFFHFDIKKRCLER
ncbi:hypothetical protein SAMN02745220_00985 [Desulfopila aestuarii DSM 18488]|uniref:Uncharacterized protein n=1 Tax=Desulfopila aestuarii DSM 18488 TaxID=1121416 RepID=A0A1M7Y0I7_9BACT|nr:hypothetical protein SAMN02745220_00985 [Desulfopila aestuarii DSM 18488]